MALLGLVASTPQDWSSYTFSKFMVDYGRDYDVKEFEMRKAAFEANLAYIVQHNEEYTRGEHTHWLGVNHLADYTKEEFEAISTGYARGKRSRLQSNFKASQSNPAEVDYRNIMTATKYQGHCGSCWAFAATEAIEAHYAISVTGNNHTTLAPRTFVDCVQNPNKCGGTGGCEGGIAQLAFDHAIEHGVALEKDLQYHAYDEACSAYTPAVKCSGWTQLPKGDGAAVETALAQHGPVTAVIRANSEAFGFYQGGTILHGCKNREGVSCSVNHGILIVGYNATAWLIRNSWGASWGYDGYAWVSRKYDTKTYNDTDVDQGVWCAPYPEMMIVNGESGILTDSAFPTGCSAASVIV